jgi:hypothetical protein
MSFGGVVVNGPFRGQYIEMPRRYFDAAVMYPEDRRVIGATTEPGLVDELPYVHIEYAHVM